MEEMPPEGAREMFRMMGQLADVPRGDDRACRGSHDPRPRRRDSRSASMTIVRTARPALVMVFYHGGGWVIGDLDTHDPYCAEAARLLDMPVIAVDYRLAPEHPFRAAPIDCEAATRWVADNIPCTGLVLRAKAPGAI